MQTVSSKLNEDNVTVSNWEIYRGFGKIKSGSDIFFCRKCWGMFLKIIFFFDVHVYAITVKRSSKMQKKKCSGFRKR